MNQSEVGFGKLLGGLVEWFGPWEFAAFKRTSERILLCCIGLPSGVLGLLPGELARLLEISGLQILLE